MATDNTDDLIISISTDQATLRRSIRRIEQDVGTMAGVIKKQFDSVGKSIDNSLTTSLQSRINAMVGLGKNATKEWNGALADQGKELERLRARYSPLFNTINNYKIAVADIRRAHAIGAISSNEMSAAIQRERQAALAATAAIKGRNAALADTPVQRGGVGAYNTSNIAAQFQDIAVTSAMGMSPLQIALQQGTQLSMVFEQMRGTGQSAGAALLSAFTSIISPISLVTIGLVAGSAALIQYFSSLDSGAKSADDILKGHAETISSLKERYGEAAEGLREYVNEGISGTIVDIRDRLDDARQAIIDAAGARSTYSPFIDPLAGSTSPDVVRAYREAFIDLRRSIAEGEPDILRFRDAMARIAEDQEAPAAVRELAKEMREFDPEVVRLARSIPGFIQQLELIGGTANDQIAGVAALSDALSKLAGIAPTALSDVERAAQIRDRALSDPRNNTEAAVREIEHAYEQAVRRSNNQNPTVINSDGNLTNVPTPGQRPITLGDAPPRSRRGGTRATASDRFASDLQGLRDRSTALAQEMQLIGLSNEMQIKRRTALDLEQSALRDLREEARRKGESDLESIQLSPEKVAAIDAEASAYAKQAESLRVAQEAHQKLVEWNGLGRDVTRGLVDDFLNGESAADAFASALSRIGDALLDDVLDSIFQVNNAAGGGGWLGNILGSIFGGGGGFKANTTLGAVLGAVPGFASGTNFAPGGLAVVGEKGPELVNLPRGSQVIPNRLTMPALRSQASASNTPSFTYAPQIDARGADVAAVARLEQAMARDRATFEARVVGAVSNANARGVRMGGSR